jgi:hypothetical protein
MNVSFTHLIRCLLITDIFLQELDDGTAGVAGPAANAGGDQILEVNPSPNFDLETYISNYTGRTRAARLKFIAIRAPSLQNDAFRFSLVLFLDFQILYAKKMGNMISDFSQRPFVSKWFL